MSKAVPLLPAFPPAGAVVGTVTLRLRFGGRFEMDTDIQDPQILVDMLRQTADAMESHTAPPPGRVVIEGSEAIPAEDLAPRR